MDEVKQPVPETPAPVETDKAPVPATTAAPAASTEVPRPEGTVTAPAKTPPTPEQAGQDWSKKYEELNKSYGELRKKLQEQGTEKNTYARDLTSLREQIKTLSDAFTKATAKPFDFGQFLEDLQARGPEALFAAIQDPLKAQQKQYEDRINSLETHLQEIGIERAVEAARGNADRYPNFKDLEASMVDIWTSGGFPFDPSKMEVGEIVDKLYNLARIRHSEDAMKAAEQLGKQRAEKELAKEAKAAIAGGGKPITPAPVDPNSLSLEELRSKIGVVSRD